MAAAAPVAGDATAAASLDDAKVMKVQTSEGRQFDVTVKILKMFKMFKEMMNVGVVDMSDDTPFPLTQVSGETFERILQWCEWHQNDPEESEDEDDDEERDRRIDDIPQWDVNFVAKMDRPQVYEMMQACNYLDLQFLLEILAKTVASWLKGKTVEQIREEFNIVCDYTPEEDEKMKKENAWAEEASARS